jgi:hypothetical protein
LEVGVDVKSKSEFGSKPGKRNDISGAKGTTAEVKK